MNEGAKYRCLPDGVDPVARHGGFTGSFMSLHGLRFSGPYRGVRAKTMCTGSGELTMIENMDQLVDDLNKVSRETLIPESGHQVESNA